MRGIALHALRGIALLLLTGILLALGGCATTSEPEDPDRVNTKPWARPERWEGTGPFGSMMPGSNY